MKKHWLALAVLSVMTSGAAFAQQAASEGSWMVRARAVHLDSVNKDSTGLGLSINDKALPEADITYFFSPNIAAELILTVPQKQKIRADGLGQIGTLRHLPPALLAQYHFTQFNGFKPYLGAGINYTRFSSVRFDPAVQAALNPTIDKDSWGGALQVGVDIPLAKNLYLNFDVKKVFIKTDVFSAGAKVGTFKINPVLAGVGLGWRF
ncbi:MULTISPECIES: OmpW family outer membrane protein [unclassified Acidovorax]|uniref:OmpW/AlkL family protein n=1 Tax=unclassified Acidovorax TaxID=2684926 RepID=UPI00288342EE|nr:MULTISPECIES: OmpW family outer membrane protein [unclassified Acidovorax]